MHRGLTVSLVIPAHNEASGLPQVLARVPPQVDEVVVVDNRSTDDTAATALHLGARVVPCLQRGYGNAYAAGLPAAMGDIIVTCDADATYPVHEIPRLVEHLLDSGLDFLTCSRFPLVQGDAMSSTLRMGNAGMTAVANLLFGSRLQDVLSGMWVMRRGVLQELVLVSGNWNFSEEIKLEAWSHPRVRFGETRIDYAPRVGHSKVFHWTVVWENLSFLFYKRLDCLRRYALRTRDL